MNILQRLARVVAPPECVFCGREDSFLCVGCQAHLPRVPRPACFGCLSPNRTGSTCRLCLQVTAVRGATVAATYDGMIHDLLINLKYRRQRELAQTFAGLLAPLLDPGNFDVVTFIPAASTRYRQRSYNQAQLIARALSDSLRLPCRPLLWRVKNHRQVGRGRADRIVQASSAFRLRSRYVPGRVLLVDDVLTTGATLDACAKLLTAQGSIVWVAAVARRED